MSCTKCVEIVLRKIYVQIEPKNMGKKMLQMLIQHYVKII